MSYDWDENSCGIYFREVNDEIFSRTSISVKEKGLSVVLLIADKKTIKRFFIRSMMNDREWSPLESLGVVSGEKKNFKRAILVSGEITRKT